MPEGPEISILAKQLRSEFQNSILQEIKKYKKIPVDDSLNLKLTDVKKKGKFLYFCFDDDNLYLGNNLGLSGNYSLLNNSSVIFQFKFNKTLYYSDIKHFSKFKLFNLNSLDKKLSAIGPD